MIKPTFPSTSEAQSHNVTFLTIKTVVRKFHQNDGNTGSCAQTRQCLRKGGGGGYNIHLVYAPPCVCTANPSHIHCRFQCSK